jgi:transposase
MGRRGRRRWTAEEKRQIVEETTVPGSLVSVVARRHDINANLLFKWKRQDEADALGGAAGPGGAGVRADRRGRAGKRWRPALLARMPAADDRIKGGVRPDGECRRASVLEARAGVIEIDLLEGARVRVAAFVDARALARVLSALKRHA